MSHVAPRANARLGLVFIFGLLVTRLCAPNRRAALRTLGRQRRDRPPRPKRYLLTTQANQTRLQT
jgi:hypothetical protein